MLRRKSRRCKRSGRHSSQTSAEEGVHWWAQICVMAFDIPDIRLTLNFISSSLWFFDCINSSTCSSIEANFTCFSPSFLVLWFCFLSLPCPCTNRSVLTSNCSVLVSTVIYSTAHRLYNQSRILETENKRCIAVADVKRPSGGRDNRY